MIILTTSAAAQTLSVIPREYSDSFTMTVRDDNTNVTKQYDITSSSTSNNYLTFDNIFNPILVENRFFDLRLYIDYNFWNTNYSFWNLYEVKWNTDDGQNIDIYNDKIFCTDQDVDQLNQNDYYKINKDQYTFYNGSDNTYTVR
jgi:hypothetical protein|tara:strand:- start:155 stop:586 length:432 start_codon:yes stop_codon:yes gene_type:complete